MVVSPLPSERTGAWYGLSGCEPLRSPRSSEIGEADASGYSQATLHYVGTLVGHCLLIFAADKTGRSLMQQTHFAHFRLAAVPNSLPCLVSQTRATLEGNTNYYHCSVTEL